MNTVPRRSLFVFLCLLTGYSLQAQPAEYKMSGKEYVEKYKDDAIKEMLMCGVPASIVLAQGMLESGNGNSALAVYANNHFGVKCHTDWSGPTYVMDDDEKNECFRKYPSVLDSYSDHSVFLKSRTRYAFLFDLRITDYKGWAKGLKEAGYATDPRYAERLIELIESHNLNRFDKVDELPNIALKTGNDKETVARVPRKVMEFNRIKYIIVKEGDSFFKISSDCSIELWQLYKYNDLGKEEKLLAGEKLYLQPKKRKAREKTHVVQKGETIRSISQLHGIKMKFLYRKNLMKPGEEPKPGDILNMRRSKKA